jgi:hypothetical protein
MRNEDPVTGAIIAIVGFLEGPAIGGSIAAAIINTAVVMASVAALSVGLQPGAGLVATGNLRFMEEL